MAAEGGGGLEVLEDMPCSPRSKMKFLCSHGGKILPRPADGHLKYVGGETRVVSVPRDINFSELKGRLSDLFDGDMVLKYQLIPEDLDALVSVKTDEDLKHMLHEYSRQENQGSPKLRAFLFPSKPTISLENQAAFVEPPSHLLEQRYIDAINGVVRRPKITPIVTTNSSIFSVSSACSSPKSNSPDLPLLPLESAAPETLPACHMGSRCRSSINSAGMNMHRVQSSPSLYRTNSPQKYRQHRHPLHQSPQQQHHHHTYHSPRPLPDLQKAPGNERLAIPPLSLGRAEFGRGLLGHGHDHHTTSFLQYKPGSSGGYDDFSVHGGCHRIDRAVSLPRSPIKKLWE